MEIHEYHGGYNIGERTEPVRYIVCHYVGGGDSSPGDALNNCKYFAGGDRGASAHYFIDDGGIWEYADPDEYYTWHCGDGHGAYGITNRNSVGIEVCIDGDEPYTEAEIGYLSELASTQITSCAITTHRARHAHISTRHMAAVATKRGTRSETASREACNRNR